MFNKKSYNELEKENRELKDRINRLESRYNYMSFVNTLWNETVYIAACRGIIDLKAQSYIYNVHKQMLNMILNEETD